MTYYIIKVGKKYYGWNGNRERMQLEEEIAYAWKYFNREEAIQDIECMIEEGKYKNMKKKIVKCDITLTEEEI